MGENRYLESKRLEIGTKTHIKEALARVFDAADCRTQAELAMVLNIRQSSISDAKRRRSIPSDWLVKLLRLNGSNPDWILTGEGPRYLRPLEDHESATTSSRSIRIMETRPPEHCTAQELVNELVRRALRDR